jgi:hypothetical protein
MSDALEQAVASWFATMRAVATALPGGTVTQRGTTVAMITGLRVATLNTVVTETVEPDLAAIAGLAAEVGTSGLPWSIQVRDALDGEVADLAMANGLSGRMSLPLMICEAADVRFRGREIAESAVVQLGVTGWHEHGRVLDLGFETGGDVLAPLAEGSALVAPGWAVYAAQIEGEQVATALGVQRAGTLGVFNVSVVPRLRGRGLGRIITERVLADGFAAGATFAFLHSSPMAEPLYRSMGFHVAETWNVFR